MRKLLLIAVLALAGCAAANTAPPLPTPIVIFVTPAPTERSAPTATPSQTPSPTPAPTPSPTPIRPYYTPAKLAHSWQTKINADKRNKRYGYKIHGAICVQETVPTATVLVTKYSCLATWNDGSKASVTIIVSADGSWIAK